MTLCAFRVIYTLTKEQRRFKAIAGITGQAAKYNGAPAFTYTVGNYTVERDGSITTEDEAGMKNLATALREQGFEIDLPETETPAEETEAEEEMTTSSWTLTMPREDFTESQIENLEKIIASKANLIKKALDCADPTVVLTEDRVAFPWGGIPLVQAASRKRGKHGGHALHHSDLPDGQERQADHRKREGSTE